MATALVASFHDLRSLQPKVIAIITEKKLEKLVIETKQTWSEADNVTTLKRIVALFVVEFLSFFDSRFLLAPHVIRNLCL